MKKRVIITIIACFFLLGLISVYANSHPANEIFPGIFTGDFKIDGLLNVTGNIISADPTEDEHVATRGYVLANSGKGGSGSGTDMMTVYFDQQGLFTPHSNNCDSGTEAFVELFSGATVGFCIEKDERAAQHWEDARKTCAAAGKRLPEVGEWKDACQNRGSLGLQNMIDDWEWASNFVENSPYGTYGFSANIMGGGGCHYGNKWDAGRFIARDSGEESTTVFRCVR